MKGGERTMSGPLDRIIDAVISVVDGRGDDSSSGDDDGGVPEKPWDGWK